LEPGTNLGRLALAAADAKRREAETPKLAKGLGLRDVSVALANGKTESWISDRTGHRSSQMIAKYKRIARTFAELALGPLTDMHKALPEWTDPDGDCHTLPLGRRRGWESNPRVTVLQTVA
jgi:hypothetical protein